MILISNDFWHKIKMYNFDSYSVLLAIATNIPVLFLCCRVTCRRHSHLVMRQQSWMMLSSTYSPLSSSVWTGRCSWLQDSLTVGSRNEAVHCSGRRSPWNTSCRWVGMSCRTGSSSGPSETRIRGKIRWAAKPVTNQTPAQTTLNSISFINPFPAKHRNVSVFSLGALLHVSWMSLEQVLITNTDEEAPETSHLKHMHKNNVIEPHVKENCRMFQSEMWIQIVLQALGYWWKTSTAALLW